MFITEMAGEYQDSFCVVTGVDTMSWMAHLVDKQFGHFLMLVGAPWFLASIG
jgi:hypothetical protein